MLSTRPCPNALPRSIRFFVCCWFVLFLPLICSVSCFAKCMVSCFRWPFRNDLWPFLLLFLRAARDDGGKLCGCVSCCLLRVFRCHVPFIYAVYAVCVMFHPCHLCVCVDVQMGFDLGPWPFIIGVCMILWSGYKFWKMKGEYWWRRHTGVYLPPNARYILMPPKEIQQVWTEFEKIGDRRLYTFHHVFAG